MCKILQPACSLGKVANNGKAARPKILDQVSSSVLTKRWDTIWD